MSRLVRVSCLVLVVLGANRAAAQTAADTTLARAYLERGAELRRQARFDSASLYLQKAAEIYEARKIWSRYVRCANLLGEVSAKQRNFEQAFAWLNRARAVGTQHEVEPGLRAITYQLLAETHKATDAYDQALGFIQQALPLQLEAHGEKHFRTANIYLYLGLISAKLGRFEQALEAYQNALSVRRAIFGENHLAVADCYNNIGLMYWRMGEYDQALKYQQKALNVRQQIRKSSRHPEIAMSYNNIAGLYWSKGDYDRSLHYMQKALEIDLAVQGEEHPNTAKAYSNVGAIYFSKGDYERALAYQKRALEIGLKSPEGYAREIATYYKNIGEVLHKQGDYEQAQNFVQKALSYYQEVFGERHPDVGRTYTILGTLSAALDDTSSALRYLRKALRILTEVYGTQHPEVADVYHSLGEVYRRAGANQPALEHCQKALDIYLAIHGKSHPAVATHYQTVGSIYLQMGQASRARGIFQKARDIQKATLGETHPDLAKSYVLLARAARKSGRYARALAHLESAVRANTRGVRSPTSTQPADSDDVYSDEILLQTLQLKARVLEARFRRSGALEEARRAFAVLQRAVNLLDQMRSGYRAEGSKLFLAQKGKSVYEDAIRVALTLFAESGDSEYQQRAFGFSEKAKAAVLRTAVSEARAKRFAGLPDSLLQQERDLRVDLAYYSTRIQEEELKRSEGDSLLLAEFRDRFFELNQHYLALGERLERDFPRYYQLKYRDPVLSVAEIQKHLDEGTTLLEYFVGDRALYLFTLSKTQFHATTRPLPPELANRIAALRRSMTHNRGEGDYARFTALARSLYLDLIEPVAAQVRPSRLIIVPDEELNTLPFEVLLSADGGRAGTLDYATLPYLLHRYSIGYAYSASLLWVTAGRPYQAPPHDYLAFAPVFSGGLPAASRGLELVQSNRGADSSRTGLGRLALPASKDEVLRIQDLFEKSYDVAIRIKQLLQPKTRVYLEQAASEINFKREPLHAYRYVHLATHGFANRAVPDLSGLLFATEPDGPEDGVLYLPEIYNLALNADLVVVSACESGTGKLAKGEGLIGLARGFFYAGARNLLVSLWQVGDWSTADLMRLFYQNLLDGQGKAEALRRAKLELLRTHPDYARPYHWAAFVLIGF